MKKYVIIGGGQAGFSAANKLRELDGTSQIDILCEENFLPYQRPPLSKAFLLGKTDIERLQFRAKIFFVENKINVHLGESAKEIAVHKKQVLTDKQKFDYDKLLIATGASPRELKIDGENVLRNISDAETLKQSLHKNNKLAIIGGGYIGLEVAAIARQLNIDVEIFEIENRILSRVACDATASHFQKLHETNGVKFYFAKSAPANVDCLLVGIGATPNIELAKQAGIKIADGIIVNQNCQTSAADIFAAGDCAQQIKSDCAKHIKNNSAKHGQRIESVANAIFQAEKAAFGMAGKKCNKNFVAWFWSDQYDTKLQIAGVNSGYDATFIREVGGKKSIWYFIGSKLIAVDAINDAPSYMLAKQMLEKDQSPSPADIVNSCLSIKDWQLQKNA